MSLGVQCPLPNVIEHSAARAMFDKVRKEMPGLSPAAWRREAARRMGTDYDTFLSAWKKPNTGGLIPGPTGSAPAGEIKITKKSVPAKDISSFSSTLKSTATNATEIQANGELIGYIQKAAEGSYERTSTGIRTGRWFADRRGYVALDKEGHVLKEGFSALHGSADEATDLLKRRFKPADVKPPPEPAPPTPGTLTREAARKAERDAAKRLGLKPGSAASRRAAADELGMTYDDFLSAWKGEVPKKPVPGKPGEPIPTKPGQVAKKDPPPVNKPDLSTEATTRKWLDQAGFEDEYVMLHNSPGNILIRFHDEALGKKALDRLVRLLGDDLELTRLGDSAGVIRRRMNWHTPGPVRTLQTGKSGIAHVHGITGDDLKNLAAELKQQLGYTSKSVTDRFTGVYHARTDKGANFASHVDPSSVLAYYRPRTGKIFLNDLALGRNADHAQIRMQQNGWFSRVHHGEGVPHGVGSQSTLAHEYGHFIDDQLMSAFARREEIMEIMGKDMGLSGSSLADFMDAKVEKIRNPIVQTAIRNHVSRYGSTNRHEFFAEVWAEYSKAGSKARPHIKKWGTMIQDVMETVE